MTSRDMMYLQGLLPGDVDHEQVGITKRQLAGMLGNAMSGNVLEFLLPCVLLAAGRISVTKSKELHRESRTRWGGP